MHAPLPDAPGGITQLIMPLIYSGIKQSGVPGFTAWRWAFFVPGGMFLVLAIMVFLFSQGKCLCRASQRFADACMHAWPNLDGTLV